MQDHTKGSLPGVIKNTTNHQTSKFNFVKFLYVVELARLYSISKVHQILICGLIIIRVKRTCGTILQREETISRNGLFQLPIHRSRVKSGLGIRVFWSDPDTGFEMRLDPVFEIRWDLA